MTRARHTLVVGAGRSGLAVAQFLAAPLYQTEYRRGWGTLYTAVYHPVEREAEFVWPGHRWTQRFEAFNEARHTVRVQWEEPPASPTDLELPL